VSRASTPCWTTTRSFIRRWCTSRRSARPSRKKYLGAAFQVFFNESFRYVRELKGERDAVLEFELELDGIASTAWT
jgi:hypothetical protein